MLLVRETTAIWVRRGGESYKRSTDRTLLSDMLRGLIVRRLIVRRELECGGS